MRIRALDRWSAVSLAMTAPSPVHGEPRRRPLEAPPGRLLGSMARLLEIAVVDFVEAWRGEVGAEQLELLGEGAGGVGPEGALAIGPVAVALPAAGRRLDPAPPR